MESGNNIWFEMFHVKGTNFHNDLWRCGPPLNPAAHAVYDDKANHRYGYSGQYGKLSFNETN